MTCIIVFVTTGTASPLATPPISATASPARTGQKQVDIQPLTDISVPLESIQPSMYMFISWELPYILLYKMHFSYSKIDALFILRNRRQNLISDLITKASLLSRYASMCN